MIGVLQEAAKIAAAASDRHNRVEIGITEAGVAVSGHVSTPYGNTAFTQTVRWQDIDADQGVLISTVSDFADLLRRHCIGLEVVTALEASKKQSVRLIQPEEWPLAIVSALAILIAIPLGGGLF
jgi:long-subunit acyl-CoA synthetase (AMP-forming)